jgi:hypothetical protein
MPVLLREGPYRVYIVSGDRDEPPHVHVQREDNIAKVWIDPVRLESSGGFRRTETNRILRIVEQNRLALVERWNDHFRD